MSDFKINRYQPIQPVQNVNPALHPEQQKKAAGESDRLEISDEAKRLQDTHRFEEARNAKVDRIKEQIDAGTYSVSAEDVAQKLYEYWNRR